MINPEDDISSHPPLADVILEGGDERLDLMASGENKYHVRADRYSDVFTRGSCTCSPFTPDGYHAAKAVYDRFNLKDFGDIRARHTRRIKNLVNYARQDEFHVFYAPSGSDLCYYQLLFANLIEPSKDILNIVTCPEELGSGSIAAMRGNNYAARNQFGNMLKVGSPISKSLNITTEMLPARDPLGRINNHSLAIESLVSEHYESHSINANLVIGSKSGIENNISIISQVPEGVLWTVDLCQFRTTKVLINGLLGMNCSVMLTGSKFYQSPPFCAALLVPKALTEKFSSHEEDIIRPFANLFSQHDIPEEFPEIYRHLSDQKNIGLLLRWEAALKEMELFAKLDTFKVNETMSVWNAFVSRSIAESEFFEAMPGQEVTNKSIISFRVKTADGDYLSHNDLAEMYCDICSKDVSQFGEYKRVLFGQPVKYGDKSFIRLALGASDLRKFVLNGFDSSYDSMLIKLMEDYVREQY